MITANSRHWPLKVSTLVVVTACFVVMGSALLVSQNFKNLLTLWGEEVQLTVYVSSDISKKSIEHIEKTLKESGQVSEVSYISQERALVDFKAQMASYAPDMSQDEELLRLIPASFQVKLAPHIPASEQAQVIKSLALKTRDLNGVDEVSYGQDWIEKYAALVSAIQITLRLLGFVIVSAALFVISNAVRASVQNRKEEIIVLEMIGATFTTIRKPFLVEGATLGFGASVFGILLCFGIYTAIRNVLISQLSFLQLGAHISFLTPVTMIVFMIFGTSLGALASYLCVRRINDGFAGLQR